MTRIKINMRRYVLQPGEREMIERLRAFGFDMPAVVPARDPGSHELVQLADDGIVPAGKHTLEQMAWYRAYEKVRAEGRYNMYSPQARELTGLDRAGYSYVMENFSSLREQAGKEIAK